MIGTIIKDRYEISKLLSESHLYEVYLAKDTQRAASVVLKFLRQELAQNVEQVKTFSEQIRCFAKLSHPSIVEIYDIDMHQDRPYVVTEYISGIDLRTWARSSEKVAFKDACNALQQMASAFHFAYKAEVQNRSVMLSNIFWTKSRNLKILSFHLPRLRLISKSDFSMGIHSDLFFLGITFYELLAGESPIQKRGGLNESWNYHLKQSLRIRHQELTPDQIEKITDFIDRTITKNIERRFQDHSIFLMKLADLAKLCCKKQTIKKSNSRTELDTASAVVDAIRWQSNITPHHGEISPSASNFRFLPVSENNTDGCVPHESWSATAARPGMPACSVSQGGRKLPRPGMPACSVSQGGRKLPTLGKSSESPNSNPAFEREVAQDTSSGQSPSSISYIAETSSPPYGKNISELRTNSFSQNTISSTTLGTATASLAKIPEVYDSCEPEKPVLGRPILTLIRGGKAMADSLIWRYSEELSWYRSPWVVFGFGIFFMFSLIFFW